MLKKVFFTFIDRVSQSMFMVKPCSRSLNTWYTPERKLNYLSPTCILIHSFFLSEILAENHAILTM